MKNAVASRRGRHIGVLNVRNMIFVISEYCFVIGAHAILDDIIECREYPNIDCNHHTLMILAHTDAVVQPDLWNETSSGIYRKWSSHLWDLEPYLQLSPYIPRYFASNGLDFKTRRIRSSVWTGFPGVLKLFEWWMFWHVKKGMGSGYTKGFRCH